MGGLRCDDDALDGLALPSTPRRPRPRGAAQRIIGRRRRLRLPAVAPPPLPGRRTLPEEPAEADEDEEAGRRPGDAADGPVWNYAKRYRSCCGCPTVVPALFGVLSCYRLRGRKIGLPLTARQMDPPLSPPPPPAFLARSPSMAAPATPPARKRPVDAAIFVEDPRDGVVEVEVGWDGRRLKVPGRRGLPPRGGLHRGAPQEKTASACRPGRGRCFRGFETEPPPPAPPLLLPCFAGTVDETMGKQRRGRAGPGTGSATCPSAVRSNSGGICAWSGVRRAPRRPSKRSFGAARDGVRDGQLELEGTGFREAPPAAQVGPHEAEAFRRIAQQL